MNRPLSKKNTGEQHIDTKLISSIFELDIHAGTPQTSQRSSSRAARTLAKSQI